MTEAVRLVIMCSALLLIAQPNDNMSPWDGNISHILCLGQNANCFIPRKGAFLPWCPKMSINGCQFENDNEPDRRGEWP